MRTAELMALILIAGEGGQLALHRPRERHGLFQTTT
jgi:hypothetical protein